MSSFVGNPNLEGVCAKYEYKLSALKSLQRMLRAPGRTGSIRKESLT